MGMGYRSNASPFMAFFTCVLIAFIVWQETNPAHGVEDTESRTTCECCQICNPCEGAEHYGFCVTERKHGNTIPDIEPHQHQGLVMACIFRCLSSRKLPTVLLVLGLSTFYVWKSHTIKKSKGPAEEEVLSPVERRKQTDLPGANDFLREVASLYQEAVREVDFATFGRRVGLHDYQIQEIINTQAEELRGEAKLKYGNWYPTRSGEGRDDLRDDIVAERIKLLPDILVQYKQLQRRVAYAG
ncbi:Hypp2272 [Branchiostoma lanceolatum]|uniref:Hypp2272 protein n=1 Tax=Branchiostoma lanceolatum TaxID=7740 RepID=A0A8J9ZSK0_BRALA|nr:Hypp2272 [Branchiostoma lanceolatum]